MQGAYSAREAYLQKLEESNEVSFVYFRNDNSEQSNLWLIGLKNIFSKQLPNMPREYITRLVMDRRHRSVGIVRGSGGAILGGITYRAFPEQGFGEIAFCAITATEQVKGFGTRLMNYTKEYAKSKDGLHYFLTYADNNAVGYFSKQGFTKEITMASDKWKGFIKDYDGGTLMEFVLNHHISYTDFTGMMKQQQEALDARIRKVSNSHLVNQGIKDQDQGGPQRPLPIQEIPGVKEAGWAEGLASGPDFRMTMGGQVCEATPENLQRFMALALDEICKCEDSWPFREPVDQNDVPDYYDVVKDPVDLQMMRARLESGRYYLTLDIFTADLRRMFANCRFYNAPETIYYKLADRLELKYDHLLSSCILA
uniref:histone acetyltransferase n=1 Tax=Tetraselmis sp. GSL018 TaxID=582737 RepID=A0A061RH03_9CHLO